MTKRTGEIKKLAKISGIGLLALVLVTLLGGILFGYRALIVDGSSMHPIIKYRSLAIVKKHAPQNIKIGDAIAYSTSSVGKKFITHQLFQVETTEGEIVAQFMPYDEAIQKVAEDGGEYYLMPYYGEHVAVWHTGEPFTKDMLFITRGTNHTLDPFDGSNDGTKKTYDNIYGTVMLSLPGVGNVIVFIQKNIILISITFFALIVLYGAIKKDLTRK